MFAKFSAMNKPIECRGFRLSCVFIAQAIIFDLQITNQDQIEKIRQKHGGKQLAVFKIGISQCLERRSIFYYEANFDEMLCIHASNSLAQVEALEAALIDHFMHIAPRECRNILLGGEGMRKKNGSPRNPPPYFVYVVAADASKRKRIGG